MSRNDQIIDNLCGIGENYQGIAWILKDGLYLPEPNSQKLVADIVLGYRAPHIMEQRYAVPIRVVHGSAELLGAYNDLRQARELIRDGMGLNCSYGKVVQYFSHFPVVRKVSL